jgi:hypothetical protein
MDSPLASPPLGIRVVRRHLSQHNIQCIFRADSDELSKVPEQFDVRAFIGDL